MATRVGVARQIAQHLFGSAEWAFAVHHPFTVAQWCQERGEVLRVGKRGMPVEELQLSGLKTVFRGVSSVLTENVRSSAKDTWRRAKRVCEAAMGERRSSGTQHGTCWLRV
jgi:hypothetical protein